MTKFDTAFLHLMDNEGFISNDPVDRGGATINGVASRYHLEWYNIILKAYERGDKERGLELTKEFYKVKFWNHLYNDIEDSSLAFRLFDFGVNAGVKKAVKIFQRSINLVNGKKLVTVDGVFGQNTLLESHTAPQERLYGMFLIKIYLFYLRRPTAWKHLKGWRNRLLKRYWL